LLKGTTFVVWDEISSCSKGIDPKEAWESIVEPCIITRWPASRSKLYGAASPGRALIISTPKGYNYFYDLYHKSEKDKDWKSYHFDYKTSPFLDAAEIERIKSNIDPLKFAREYEASFAESGNSVFYMFDRKLHVRNDLEDFKENEEVHVCIDFNVGIQATSVFALRGGQMHFLDEMSGHPDTETLAISISTKYKGHKIFAYPDPTGRARKASAPVGRTDFSILESYGIRCLARQKSPPIIDGVNAVNRMLKSARSETNLYIHPRCQGLIKSVERTRWVDNNADTATIDKSESIEHFSDGLRYGTEYLFPVLTGTSRIKRGFNF